MRVLEEVYDFILIIAISITSGFSPAFGASLSGMVAIN